MRIINTQPPNFEEICLALPFVRSMDRVIFTYGDCIYIPKAGVDTLLPELMAHEEVHSFSQGKDPAGWWTKYLADPEFRFHQELTAYKVQYKVAKTLYNRQQTKIILNNIAKDLASPMYGKLCRNKAHARILIKEPL